MKSLFSSLAALLLASQQLIANPADAVVIKGRSLWSPSSDSVKNIFEDRYGFDVDVVDFKQAGKYDFSDTKIIYFPGGDYLAFELAPNVKENIANAIANGTGYIGTCGGALIMSESTPGGENMAIFPGREEFGGGIGNKQYLFDTDHAIVKNFRDRDKINPVHTIHYNGGPGDFILNENAKGLENWVVARHSHTGKPAIIAFVRGKGRVMLMSPHPERPLSLPPEIVKAHEIIHLASDWALGLSDAQKDGGISVKWDIPEAGEPGELLKFSAVGTSDESGYPLGYSWDFGDGAAKQFTIKAEHAFEQPGRYPVTLSVTDGARTEKMVRTIKIGNGKSVGEPVVSFESPFKFNELTGTIPVRVRAFVPGRGTADDGAGVKQVTITIDGRVFKRWTKAPYEFELDTLDLDDGGHTLRALAQADDGSGKSVEISVAVINQRPKNEPQPWEVYENLLRTKSYDIMQDVGLKKGSSFKSCSLPWLVGMGYWLPYRDNSIIGDAFRDAYLVLGQKLSDNFRITFEAELFEGKKPEIAFWFRGDSVKLDAEAYFVSLKKDGAKLQRLGEDVAMTKDAKFPSIDFGRSNIVRISQNQGVIEVFLNDLSKPIISWRDRSPLKGDYAGFYLWNESAMFKNIIISP